jgi:hypothetical protein
MIFSLASIFETKYLAAATGMRSRQIQSFAVKQWNLPSVTTSKKRFVALDRCKQECLFRLLMGNKTENHASTNHEKLKLAALYREKTFAVIPHKYVEKFGQIDA